MIDVHLGWAFVAGLRGHLPVPGHIYLLCIYICLCICLGVYIGIYIYLYIYMFVCIRIHAYIYLLIYYNFFLVGACQAMPVTVI